MHAQMAAPTEDPAYRLRANGCGPEGLQVQEQFGLHKCCNGHDVCYGTCGVHFEYCERRFDECMQGVCKLYESAAPEMFEQCNTQRMTFAGMTTMLGNRFFLNSQRDACQCYPDEQAAHDRYHDAILHLHQVPTRQQHPFESSRERVARCWACVGSHDARATVRRSLCKRRARVLQPVQKYRKDRGTAELVSELMSRYRGKEGQLLYELTRRYAKRAVQFDQGVKEDL